MRPAQVLTLVRQAGVRWLEDDAPQQSAALAYYAIFSIAPLLIIAISVGGIFLGEKAAEGRIVGEATQYVGQVGAAAMESMVVSARKSGKGMVASSISLVVLLFGATGVFTQLRNSLNTIWRTSRPSASGVWGYVSDRGLAFLMVLAIGALLLFSVAVSALLAAVTGFAAQLAPVHSLLLHGTDLLGTALVATLLFALIFKVLPEAQIGWSDVWIGSIITALLFTAGKMAIGFYIGHSSVASSYGLAGSVIVILLWTYYSALILLFGAELTHEYATRYRSHPNPVGPAGSPLTKPREVTALRLETEPGSLRKDNPMSAIESKTQYLEKEVARTKLEIQATLQSLKTTVEKAANPVAWTRQYPWTSIGIALAAGLLAGTQIRFSDAKEAPREWRRAWRRGRREAARGRRAARDLYSQLLGNGDAAGRKRSNWFAPFARAGIKMLRILVESVISSSFATRTTPSSAGAVPAEEEMGHA